MGLPRWSHGPSRLNDSLDSFIFRADFTKARTSPRNLRFPSIIQMTQPEESNSRVPRMAMKRFLGRTQREGMGALVRRTIGRFELRYFDPFLLLDEFSVTPPAGFLDHPHRGFESVTYMLQGSMTHEDFEGHKGTVTTGGVQWMTAGRGIVHSEMPASHATLNTGLQLWINLSSSHKMIEPKYQEIKSEDIPEASRDGVKVRVIAGESMGAKSPVHTTTPAVYLDFSLRPGSRLWQPIPATWNAFVYVLEGEVAIVHHAPASAHCLLLLGPGDALEASNQSGGPVRFILVAGEPLGEPVVQLGPFVMNTQDEIEATVADYDDFANGFEKARGWKSQAAIAMGLQLD